MSGVVNPHLRRRRTMLLAWSAPLVALALVAGVFLVWVAAVAGAATAAFHDGRDEGALDGYHSLTHVNVVERWKAPYGQGTMRYLLGEPFPSVLALERAWELVPHREPVASDDECRVAINLSLAYETLGDEAVAAGDPESAIAYFEKAVAMSGRCTQESRDDEAGDTQMSVDGTVAYERQLAKLEQSQSDSNQSNDGSGGDGDGGQGDGGEGSDGDGGGTGEDGDADQGDGDADQGDGDTDQGDGDNGDDSGDADGDGSDQGGSSGDGDEADGDGGGSIFDEIRDRNQEANDIGDEQDQIGGGGSGGGQNW